MGIEVQSERLSQHKCSRCSHPMIRTELEQAPEDGGGRVVGFTCRHHSYNPFNQYRECGYWVIVYDGGRKVPRERKQDATRPWVSRGRK